MECEKCGCKIIEIVTDHIIQTVSYEGGTRQLLHLDFRTSDESIHICTNCGSEEIKWND